MNYIYKRNGKLVEYKREKIVAAVQKALVASGTEISEAAVQADTIAAEVEFIIINNSKQPISTVEDIQDEVEKTLIRHNMAEGAKAYILYRKKRHLIRESATELNKQLSEIFDSSALESDLKRDNANVDGDCAMGTMLQVGAAASKNFYAENYLTPEEKTAHQSGDIHIHDFDFYALTETCCQIDFKALAERGFSTGHGFIRPPQSIQSYAALACIAIQANQNDQHGGQSIPNFDYAMAAGVKKTFRKELCKHLAEVLMMEVIRGRCQNCMFVEDTQLDIKWVESVIEDVEIEHDIEIGIANVRAYTEMFIEAIRRKAHELYREAFDISTNSAFEVQIDVLDGYVTFAIARAVQETEKATHQAMESLIHNLNSMHSRAGAQVPFSSLNYGTDTSAEGRMVVRQLLLATDEGLGNGETPIFPIQIFKVKEGVNYYEDDPNYDLFKLAMKVSAKRLFPNFTFIDAPFNLQYYVSGHPETEVATMGCRTRVMGNVYEPASIENGEYHPNGEVAYGRGNLSFTSINLPRLAILAHGDEEKFFDSLKSVMELVSQQLLHRFDIQSRRHVYNYPFLMGQGIWRGSEKLNWDDEVGEVLKHGSLSIGFIGLAETLVALYGHHHGESNEMQQKGLEIISFMRTFTDRKARETKLNFTLLATPAEGLSGYFVRKDAKLFGKIPGVTDREYYTNSFHVPVYYNISAFEKIQKEAPYHALCNAGHISYVELDGDTANNLEAFEAIIRCMHDAGIGYGSINHPVDRDPVCGYVGVIGDVCPRCGRREGEGISKEKIAELRKKYPDVPAFIGAE